MVDLDGFKPINDELGHPAGDELLKTIASRLRTELRETDRVARLGGDEFGVIAEDCRTREDVEVVAHKIAGMIARPIELRGREVGVSASIGVALLQDEETDAEELLERADGAMYRCKGLSGPAVVFHGDPGAAD